MFCPKCGTNNPEDCKFCRTCGADIGNVRAALEGRLVSQTAERFHTAGLGLRSRRAVRRLDPNEVYADAIRRMVSGCGFFLISMILLTTGVAGGGSWWWAMLFPAFTFIASGISDLMKSRKMERGLDIIGTSREIPQPAAAAGTRTLPKAEMDFIPVARSLDTGDFAAPLSVTENTTNRLELDSESETIALPKKY